LPQKRLVDIDVIFFCFLPCCNLCSKGRSEFRRVCIAVSINVFTWKYTN